MMKHCLVFDILLGEWFPLDGYTSDLRGSDAESPHFVAKGSTCLNFSQLVFCDFVFGCRVACAMVLSRASFPARCAASSWFPGATLNSY